MSESETSETFQVFTQTSLTHLCANYYKLMLCSQTFFNPIDLYLNF